MTALMLNIGLLMAAAAMLWRGVPTALRGLVWLVEMALVMAVVMPRARSAARSEKALPARELALDFGGDKASAQLFAAIVRDRLTRARMVAQYPRMTWSATRLGRRLGSARA